MDSPEALPQLLTPTVPEDFNGGVGVEFARALMVLLQSAQVTGGNLSATQPFDVAALQSQVATLSEQLDNTKLKQRFIVMDGVDNGEVIVPFDDIKTVNYSVWAVMVINPGENPPKIGVAVVEGSKTTTQFKARIDGLAAPFKFEFTVMERKPDAPVVE